MLYICIMDLIDLTLKEITKFMSENNILINLRINGTEGYKPDGELPDEQMEKLKRKLLELTTFEERVNMLVKHHYGSYEKMDKALGVSGHRAKFKRWIKHSKEMAKLINSKPNIK